MVKSIVNNIHTRRIKKKVSSTLYFLLLVISMGVNADDSLSYAKSGHIRVSNYQLEFECAGKGAPNVFLEAPSGISARDAFHKIFNEIAKTNKVCFCERLGFGRSDPIPEGLDQSVKDYAKELDALIKSQSDSQEIVLVGYSFGGFIARYYAAKHPQRVKGIVLIDAAHENWLVEVKSLMSDSDWNKMQGILNWFQTTLGHNYWASQFEMAEAVLPKSMRVNIVSRGQPYQRIRQAGISEQGITIYNELHDKYQRAQLTLTFNTSRVIAKKSEHLIVDSEPDVVMSALTQLINLK